MAARRRFVAWPFLLLLCIPVGSQTTMSAPEGEVPELRHCKEPCPEPLMWGRAPPVRMLAPPDRDTQPWAFEKAAEYVEMVETCREWYVRKILKASEGRAPTGVPFNAKCVVKRRRFFYTQARQVAADNVGCIETSKQCAIMAAVKKHDGLGSFYSIATEMHLLALGSGCRYYFLTPGHHAHGTGKTFVSDVGNLLAFNDGCEADAEPEDLAKNYTGGVKEIVRVLDEDFQGTGQRAVVNEPEECPMSTFCAVASKAVEPFQALRFPDEIQALGHMIRRGKFLRREQEYNYREQLLWQPPPVPSGKILVRILLHVRRGDVSTAKNKKHYTENVDIQRALEVLVADFELALKLIAESCQSHNGAPARVCAHRDFFFVAFLASEAPLDAKGDVDLGIFDIEAWKKVLKRVGGALRPQVAPYCGVKVDKDCMLKLGDNDAISTLYNMIQADVLLGDYSTFPRSASRFSEGLQFYYSDLRREATPDMSRNHALRLGSIIDMLFALSAEHVQDSEQSVAD